MSQKSGPAGYGIAAALLLTATGLLYLLTATRVESPGSDTSIYWGLAENLLNDGRYWFNFAPHTIYPPGFPGLLAAGMGLLGESYARLTVANAAVGLLGLVAAYWLFRIKTDVRYALLIAALFAVSPVCHYYITGGLSSDPTFFTTTILVLLSAELFARQENGLQKAFFWCAVVLLSGFLVLVRGVGITVACGLLAWGLFPVLRPGPDGTRLVSGRLKLAVPAAVFAFVVFGAWSAWANANATPDFTNLYMNSYVTQLTKSDPHVIDSEHIGVVDVPERIATMAGVRGSNLLRNLTGLTYVKPSLLFFPVFSVVVLILVGLTRTILRSDTPVEWYVLAYLGLITLYPFDEGGRYLLPIWPFLMDYLIKGVLAVRSAVVDGMSTKAANALLAGAVVLLVSSVVSLATSDAVGMQDLGSVGLWGATLAALLAYRWINAKTPDLVGGLVGTPLMRRSALALSVLLFTAIAASGGQRIAQQVAITRAGWEGNQLRYDAIVASEWFSQNTQMSDVLMGEHYGILHRYTNRRAYRFPLTTDPQAMVRAMREYDVSYVVVFDEGEFEYYTPSAERRFGALREDFPGAFELVSTLEVGAVYRVDKDVLGQM